ncbi:MAG: N-acetyltransferase family protein [Vicinamibacterales bacterium]
MTFDPDPWLSAICGYAVFRASSPETPPGQDLPAVSGGARALHYTRVPTTAVGTVRDLTRLGFGVVDISMTFEREPSTDVGEAADGAVEVGDAREDEGEALAEIAASSFSFSRFHSDPDIEPGVAASVKREWVRSYATGRRGRRLLVARVDGHPAGFLAELAVEREGRSVGVIDLVGVGVPWQRRGVGRTLVARWVTSCVGQYASLRVGTQAANVPSIRLYEGLGFRLLSSEFVLHAHVGR